MFRILGGSLLIVSLCVLGVDAGGAKDKVKDKDVVKDKKYEVPKNAIAGTVKSVDLKAKSFNLTVEGKDRKFLVDDKSEFYGPRGGDRGTGPAGLKDDCMAQGYKINIVASKDGKTATEVHLPNRKSDKEKKDKS
jgi:hypothetical protein